MPLDQILFMLVHCPFAGQKKSLGPKLVSCLLAQAWSNWTSWIKVGYACWTGVADAGRSEGVPYLCETSLSDCSELWIKVAVILFLKDQSTNLKLKIHL